MAVQVLDSNDLVEATVTGKVPVPTGIAEDNILQLQRKGTPEVEKPEPKTASGGDSTVLKKPEAKTEAKAEKEEADPKAEVEDEEGLTPTQRAEWTEAMKRTIGKKHRKQMEAEEFALSQYNEKQLAEQRAENLERQLSDLQAKLKPAETVEAKAPERSAFASDQEYQDALVDWKVDQRFKVREAEAATQREEQRLAEVRQQAIARMDRAMELVPDYREVTGAIDWPVPPAIAGYMQESELIAELGYYLAHHPQDRARLDSLSPGRQLVEIGKIESKLSPFASAKDVKAEIDDTAPEPSTTVATPSKPRVQAPIIRPLNTGSSAQVQRAEEDKTPSQIIADYQRKHGVKLTARKRH